MLDPLRSTSNSVRPLDETPMDAHARLTVTVAGGYQRAVAAKGLLSAPAKLPVRTTTPPPPPTPKSWYAPPFSDTLNVLLVLSK